MTKRLAIGLLLVARAAWADEPAAATPPDGPPSPPPEATSAPAPAAPTPETKPAAAEVIRTVAPHFEWQPFGYLRLQYLMVQNDPNVPYVGRDDGFELQNARFGFRGSLDRRVSFVLSIDGAVDERAQVNSPDGKLRVGLRDAYADFVLAGAVVARGGFFQTILDPEAFVGDLDRAFVDHPIETRGMRATEGYQAAGLTPGRSLGAAIRLDPKTADTVALGFEVAVQNGADEYASNNDNDKPAVSAAVIARLPHASWITAGIRYNPRTVGDLPLRRDEDDVEGSIGAMVQAGPVSLGGGLVMIHTTYPTTDGPAQNAIGAHGQLMVALPVGAPLAVGYRFGLLDPSSLLTADRVMEHTVGAVLGVPRYRMRVQLQFTHVVEQAARDLANDRAQLAAEVAL